MRKVTMQVETWPTRQPFAITGHIFTEAAVLVVSVTEEGSTGRGEASGVYYLGETAETLLQQAESIRSSLEKGLGRDELQSLLPAGGARNAIDCALWDLESKLAGSSVWSLAGIAIQTTKTVNTIGIDTPDIMAAAAAGMDSSLLKIKLNGRQPLACMQAIRSARPDAELVVDVNQGWTFDQLVDLAPAFKSLGVAMIEQPLPRGGDEMLEHYSSPVPLCADESCLDCSELAQAAERYQMINIKLDKTGGLTEALALAKAAKQKGLGLMVGNMLGTSLAMAPAFVVAQYCALADLDGPLLLKSDRHNGMTYKSGLVSPPQPALWG